MRFYKKGQESGMSGGLQTIVSWAVIIGVALLIVVITLKYTEVGKTAWTNIKNTFSFV